MLRRKRFFIAMRLLFVGAIFLIISNLMDVLSSFLNLDLILIFSWINWISQLMGFIFTIIGLAFVMTINKSFLLAFIFTCISSISSFMTIPFNWLGSIILNKALLINVPSTILSVLVILSYYKIFDGISWYFDTLGDRKRSYMGISYAKTFSIFIIAGCVVSWINAIFSSKFGIDYIFAPFLFIDFIEASLFTTAYTIYSVYLGKSMNEDF